MKNAFLLLSLSLCLSLFGCGKDASNADDNQEPVDQLSGDDGTIVTVSVFGKKGDGYSNLDKDLTYVVGETCQTWSRAVNNPTSSDPVQEPHDHYNAASGVTYDGGVLTWTEFGPEHSQQEIEATCAAAMDGVTKTVNTTDYTQGNSNGGFYLKITKVETPSN